MKARLWFVAIGVLAAVVVLNALVAALFEGVIYPGVSVAGHDLSFKNRAQALQVLRSQNLDRRFDLRVGDKTFIATNSDLGAEYELGATIEAAYNVGRNWPLPLAGLIEASNKGTVGYAYNINNTQLSKFTDSVVSSVGRDPVNATLQITDGNINVVPDRDGLRVDRRYLNDLIANALADGKDQTISLQPVPKKADILAKDTAAAQKRAEDYLSRQISLSYNGKTFVLDRTALGYMIVFNIVSGSDGRPELKADISKEQILGYLQSVANQVDVAAQNKIVVVRNGANSVEQEGKNGTTINQQPAADAIFTALQNGQNTTIALTDSPVPFQTQTSNSNGPDARMYIEINLSSQRLWAYQDGQVVYSSPITSGATGKGFPTVTGTFAIYAKERNRYLNGAVYGYDYNVFVQYWMPFYQGYGLHDASWRNSFGGQDYWLNGSHGCVNMPLAAAVFLYDWAPIGTPVWVHS